MAYHFKILMLKVISFFIISIYFSHNLYSSDEPPLKKQRLNEGGAAVPGANQPPPAPTVVLPPTAHTQVPPGTGHGHDQIQQGHSVTSTLSTGEVTHHTQEHVEGGAQSTLHPSTTGLTSSSTATTTSTNAPPSSAMMPQPTEAPPHQVSPFPEGWSLRSPFTFIIKGSVPIDFKPIHQSLKTLMDGFTQAQPQDYVKKEGEEGEQASRRNIVVGNLQIIFQLPNDQYHTLNANLEYELEPGKTIIFQSGFKKPQDIGNYKIINGNEKIIPLSTFVDFISPLYLYPSNIIGQDLYNKFKLEVDGASSTVQAAENLPDRKKSEKLRPLFSQDGGFCQVYGHSEQFLIHTMFGQDALRHNIHKAISQHTQNVKNGKIIALVLHVHSYFDLCQRCSVTLSKHAEDLAYKEDQNPTSLFSLISVENTDHITNLLNSHQISIAPDVKLHIVASSQHALRDRRIVMNGMRGNSSYQQPFDVMSQGTFMFQIDPQTKNLQ